MEVPMSGRHGLCELRSLATLVGALLLAACPGEDSVEITATASADGASVALRARLSLVRAHRLPADAGAAELFSGRAHLALRVPAGWTATGRYEIGGTSYTLMPAPLVADPYQEAYPLAETRWIGFVSHLHTGLDAYAPVDVTVIAARGGTGAAGVGELGDGGPETTRAQTAIGVGIGLAPAYPGWRNRLRAPRTVSVASAVHTFPAP